MWHRIGAVVHASLKTRAAIEVAQLAAYLTLEGAAADS